METGLTPGPRFSYGEAMHKPVPLFPLLLILTLLPGLSSCSDRVETIHILTDRKELASAAEIYNTANEDVIVTIHHVSGIDDKTVENENPDLIIGSFLSSPEITDLLRPSEMTFPVYEALGGPRDGKGRSILTPLSFELPLIMGRRETMSTLPDTMLIRPEELRNAAEPFAMKNKDGRLIRLGFSPAWNPRSFTDLLALRAPGLFSGGMEQIDGDLLDQTVDEIRSWIVESAGDVDSDTAFNKRYRYIPDEYLLMNGRILFARTDFNYWATLPDTITENLDIRYLSGPRTIPVIRVTSAGIPRKSTSPEASADFIQWLMTPENQSLLMDRWERDGISVFGFFGGLSSIPDVNESILIRHNPTMGSMIPEGHYLQVPDSYPLRWPRIRDEVVTPWFQAAVAGSAREQTLTEAYRKWDLSSLKESR